LCRRPVEAENVSTIQIDEQAGLALERISRILPQMPAYNSSVSFHINSVTTSSSTATSVYISQVADIGTPGAVSYANAALNSYLPLQETHNRADRVRQLLKQRFPSVVARFSSAEQAGKQHQIGTGLPTGAAQEMRNLVDAIQGEVFATARTTPKENMTWSTMSDRLGRDPGSRAVLRNQEFVRSALYGDLSDAAKQRSPGSIDALWSRTLDHLLVVCRKLSRDTLANIGLRPTAAGAILEPPRLKPKR
jgi:hypothetical protein